MTKQNPDYSYAIIYRIRSKNCPEVYIGSTTQRMVDRYKSHVVEYNARMKGKIRGQTASAEILVWGDCSVELIESFPCETREELLRREGYWIRQEECCINTNIAGRTRNEYANEKQSYRQLTEEQREKHREQVRRYHSLHKDYLRENAQKNRDAKKTARLNHGIE